MAPTDTRFPRSDAIRFCTLPLLALLIGVTAPPASAARIACTEQALHAEIQRVNACTDYQGACSVSGRTITFDCSNQSIVIDADLNARKTCDGGDPFGSTCTSDSDCGGSSCRLNRQGCNGSNATATCTGAGQPFACCTGSGSGNCCDGDKTRRVITADDVTIDGENRNITFVQDPPCNFNYDSSTCGTVEGQTWLFKGKGDRLTIRGIRMTHFWEGIKLHGEDSVLADSELISPCDDAFVIVPDAGQYPKNVTLRNTLISTGCDKCVTLDGHDLPDNDLTFPDYNARLIDNEFRQCRVPIQIDEGRHLIEGNLFVDGGGAWDCHGGYVGHEAKPSRDGIAFLKDNTFDGCRFGWRVRGRGATVSMGGNVFENSTYAGVGVTGDAKALFECDVFRNNGGTASTRDHEGGIYVTDSARVDLGGGSVSIDGEVRVSQGHNQFIDNHANEAGQIVTVEVWNRASGDPVRARNNWWNTADPAQVASSLLGPVDYQPLHQNDQLPCGSSGGDEDGPPPPDIYRRDQQSTGP